VSWDGTTLKELTHLPTTLFSLIWISINLFTIYHLLQSYFSF
ncbi:MAG: M50 family metallopeptidase, partial [Staphylococcus saprophyticus]